MAQQRIYMAFLSIEYEESVERGLPSVSRGLFNALLASNLSIKTFDLCSFDMRWTSNFQYFVLNSIIFNRLIFMSSLYILGLTVENFKDAGHENFRLVLKQAYKMGTSTGEDDTFLCWAKHRSFTQANGCQDFGYASVSLVCYWVALVKTSQWTKIC